MASKDEIKKRIFKLREQITDLRYRYHVLNDPHVTDEVYDSLSRELKGLEERHPEFKDPNSPVSRVAGKALDKFQKVTHSVPMLSLNDVFSKDELFDWEKRVKKLLPSGAKLGYFCEIKFDGLAVSLIYENGKFAKGSTRGDGQIGEDVTENLKMIDVIPLVLSAPFPKKIEVRGEALMSKAVWARLNERNNQEGKPLFANTRNAAAGSLRQLDPSLAKERGLDFFAYDIAQISADFNQPKAHSEKHELLRKLGFPVDARHERKCRSLEEAMEFIDEIEKVRPNYPYGTDGVVVSVDDLDLQKVLGVVGKAPRFMAAFKYPPEKATTTVEKILVNVGRTGALTPLAVFKPTKVAGSTISKATLHNMDQIERLDVRVGDTVVIQKAGDVIPEVVEVLKKMRSGSEKKFKMPSKCPVCAGKVEKRRAAEGGRSTVAYYCTNQACPAKNRRAMQHFVNAFEIYTVGPKILDRFQGEGLISDVADLFTLEKSDISSLERFGEKSAENILASIKEHKKVPFWRFLYALGILHVGEETARDLAENFGELDNLLKASLDRINDIENIGPAVAKSVHDYFHEPENIKFINKLLKNGVEIIKEKPKTGKLKGLSFVITGTLSGMSREKAKEEIVEQGGKVSSSVSKETDYLVVGEEPGSKFNKAEKLGVKILNEGQFVRLLGK